MSQCNILLAFVTGMTYCYDLSFETLCRDELPNLEYLTMCIKESLRIHPPVPNISRQITKPITFPNGLTAPAGQYTVNITPSSTNERGISFPPIPPITQGPISLLPGSPTSLSGAPGMQPEPNSAIQSASALPAPYNAIYSA